jgi:hypothetical protein
MSSARKTFVETDRVKLMSQIKELCVRETEGLSPFTADSGLLMVGPNTRAGWEWVEEEKRYVLYGVRGTVNRGPLYIEWSHFHFYDTTDYPEDIGDKYLIGARLCTDEEGGSLITDYHHFFGGFYTLTLEEYHGKKNVVVTYDQNTGRFTEVGVMPEGGNFFPSV